MTLLLFGKQTEFLMKKFSYQRIQGIGAGSLCMMKNKFLVNEFFQQSIDIRMDADCSGTLDSKFVKDGENAEAAQFLG